MSKGKGFLLTILLLFCMCIGSTVAYLTAQTPEIMNVMLPGMVPPKIEEDFDGTLKQNVRVRNNGNTAAFVRAAVVINWKDEFGNIASTVPIPNEDYSIVWSDSGWQKIGNFYYCTVPVEPQDTTPVFIDKISQKTTRDQYDLVVDITAQTIQANGIDSCGRAPVELAWDVIIKNGKVYPAGQTEEVNQ